MSPDRHSYVIGAIKIPYAQRDVAHAVLTEADDRGFFNVIGADDDPDAGHVQPIGSNVTYRAELTDEEAELFRTASNCRYVELDTLDAPAVPIPESATLTFMRADFASADQFHGRDVTVGLLDSGTTAAVRAYIGATLVARQVFGPDDPGGAEITSTHGCLVAPTLIPPGGRFLDAITAGNDGVTPVSAFAAGARWCADNGATVVNYSYGGATLNSAHTDGVQYLKDRDVQFFASMGNDGLNQADYPAGLSTTYSNCHSSISFDKSTGLRAASSNYTATASGCAPGVSELGLSPTAVTVRWSGTSCSSPHMARLCAMGATGGRFSAAQVGAALKANTRDTGQPAAQQGGGAYSLEAALAALGAFQSGDFPYAGYPDGVPYPTIPLGTTTVNVTSSATLTTALANAVAGQRIMLGSGTYSGAFTIAKTGTSTNGISVEASSTGGAVFAAGSTFLVNNSAYITLKGLSFPYENSSGNVIGFRGSSHNCRVTRCLFGPPSLGTAGTTKATFVYGGDDVNHIRVDHNEIRFKTNPGNAILFDGNFTSFQTCQHIRIDHNYIHDIKPEVANEKEPVRLGVSTMSKTFSYSVVERNVFVGCIAEPEIVSIKSCVNRVSGNTFLRNIGGPVYRHGTGGVLTDNYIVDDGTSAPPPPDPAGTYRWFKFAPTVLRNGATANAVQLSEFAVLNGTTRLTGMTITATNNNSPAGEDPAKAGDDSTATKWVSLNKTASELIYNFASPTMATGYRWATANDATERDPVSWTVHGSTDGSSYTLLDTRTNYATPASRNYFLPDFGFGGTGGGPPPGTQTLGVGGVATPVGAILATSDQPGVELNITTSGTAGNPRVYDGQGHRIGLVKVRASYVTVQNYRIESQQQYGVDVVVRQDHSNIIIQNNDIKDCRPTGDGDMNAVTLTGDDITIAYNTAINFIGVSDAGGSHTDGIQTWNNSGDESTSNLRVIGNWFEGEPDDANADDPTHINQGLIGEGANASSGGGGTGVSQNWFVADNYWTADCKFDDIDDVTFTRNTFAGIDKRAVVVSGESSGFKYYSDNRVTGQFTVELGADIIPGGGPATPTW